MEVKRVTRIPALNPSATTTPVCILPNSTDSKRGEVPVWLQGRLQGGLSARFPPRLGCISPHPRKSPVSKSPRCPTPPMGYPRRGGHDDNLPNLFPLVLSPKCFPFSMFWNLLKLLLSQEDNWKASFLTTCLSSSRVQSHPPDSHWCVLLPGIWALDLGSVPFLPALPAPVSGVHACPSCHT